MNLQELAVEYRRTAEQVEARLARRKEEQKTARGEESLLLEGRVAALYAELLDLRKISAYLTHYWEKEGRHGFPLES